jgi:hypothetical protein
MFFATIAVLIVVGYSLAFIWVIVRGLIRQWKSKH